MDYREYLQKVKTISELSKANHLKESEDAILQLILSDISDLDKAELCVILAGVYDRKGNTEEALGWFDKGMAYEQPFSRFEVIAKKAEYLAQIGHIEDAIKMFESLLKELYVKESEKEDLRKKIKNLLGKTLRGWQ